MSNFDEIFGSAGFKASEVPDTNNFEPLPPGWYTVMVSKADVVETKARDGSRIKIELDVLTESHSGRKLFGGFNIVNPNPQAVEIAMRELAQFSLACGLATAHDTSEFIDKVLMVKVAVKASSDGVSSDNDIKGYKACEGAAPAVTAPQAKPTVKPAAKPTAKPASTPSETAPAARGKFPWEK